jgi:glucan biosynthesis protein C
MQTDKQTLAADPARLHSLDAVRAFALLLGVVLHATLSFFPQRIWLVDDVSDSSAMSLLFFVIHMLRMLTFFLLAGFVARMSFHKMGAAAFFRDRAKRIGIPLLAGWPLLFVGIVIAIIAGAVLANGGKMPTEKPPPTSFSFTEFPLTHLWFLYFLVLFYVCLAVLRPVAELLDRQGRAGWLRAATDRVMGFLLHQWAPLLLAAPLCLALYLQPYWMMWFGIPTPDHGFVPIASSFVAYGGAFLFGWLAQRQAGVLDLWKRRWLAHLVLAIGMTVACLAMAGITPVLMPVPQGTLKLAFAACYSIGAWSWAFALLGLALRFLSGYSALRRYLADASYWIYLVHLPLVLLLQALVSQLAWPWFIKFPLVLAVAFLLMLASYAWLVRGTWIGVVLNGRRKAPAPLPARAVLSHAGRA